MPIIILTCACLTIAYQLSVLWMLSKQSFLSGMHCPISYTKTSHWLVSDQRRLWCSS